MIVPSRTLVARFASKDRNRERRKQFDTKISQNIEEINSLPEFHHLLRQLYKKSHPDLLRASNPDFADINDASMQILNGILSSIKVYNEYPPQIVKTIPFHVRNAGKIDRIDLKIKTAGGDCRRSLTSSFENFFIDTGIIDSNIEKGKDSFVWGKDYFPKIEGKKDEESKESA
jgi:hypothetical protein